jgi:pimeloyl-ACP methyl ester carboxylesterase
LSGIKAPTLLIGGDLDFVTATDLELMHQRIPKSTVHICPNSGHFAYWDNPPDYFGALLHFVEGLPRR